MKLGGLPIVGMESDEIVSRLYRTTFQQARGFVSSRTIYR